MGRCRWTESIAQKVKRKKKAPDAHSRKQILRSVFEPAIQPTSISLGPVSVELRQMITQGLCCLGEDIGP